MQIIRKRQVSKIIAHLILIAVFLIGCDILTNGGNEPPPKNDLSTKDSLAVRAILDTNGLNNVKVRKVISLANSRVGVISLDSVVLKKFIFTSSFDSLGGGTTLNIFNSQLDSIIILDTLNLQLTLQISNTTLRSIPNNISMLKGPISFYLPNNKIQYISFEIMKCNVRYIDVQYNALCSVSDSLNSWIIANSRNSSWRSTQNCH
jgi:hypothetical protein